VAWGNNADGQSTIPSSVRFLDLSVSGTVNTNAPGSYTVAYNSFNAIGGVGAGVTRTVVVQDTIPPVVTMNGSNVILITNLSSLPFHDPGATASDICGGYLPVVANSSVNVNFPGIYPITYRSTDSSSNVGTATRTVYVLLPPAVPGDLDGDGIVSRLELDRVYANYVTKSPWLFMTNIAGLGGTNVSFGLSDSVFGAYSVEYTTNLTDWFPIGSATPRYIFIDTNALAHPQRYYRLSWP
jgi:Domain of unknown function (DUF5011)